MGQFEFQYETSMMFSYIRKNYFTNVEKNSIAKIRQPWLVTSIGTKYSRAPVEKIKWGNTIITIPWAHKCPPRSIIMQEPPPLPAPCTELLQFVSSKLANTYDLIVTWWCQEIMVNIGWGNGCCLTAPSHYLHPCWCIITKILWHSYLRPVSQGILKITATERCLKITYQNYSHFFLWPVS